MASAPVLFTARGGATLSGRVWATVKGPAKRPGVVITDGSVQADEQMYWYAAQTLAKDGYIVLTSIPGPGTQRHARADARRRRRRAGADRRASRSTTAPRTRWTSSCRRRSTPMSRSQAAKRGTSHAAKQNERVAKGLDGPTTRLETAQQPRDRLAGHSYGAVGVSTSPSGTHA